LVVVIEERIWIRGSYWNVEFEVGFRARDADLDETTEEPDRGEIEEEKKLLGL